MESGKVREKAVLQEKEKAKAREKIGQGQAKEIRHGREKGVGTASQDGGPAKRRRRTARMQSPRRRIQRNRGGRT